MLHPTHLPLLSLIPLFAGLSLAELVALAEVSHLLLLPKRTNLSVGDQRGEFVYFLLEGTAKVYLPDETQPTPNIPTLSKSKTLAIVGPEEVLGIVNTLDGQGHTANILTLEPTRLLWINRADFLRLEEEIPRLSRNLSRLLAKRLRLLSEDKLALSTMTVKQRVTHYLLNLANSHHEEAAQKILEAPRERSASSPHPALPIPVRISQGDLADMVGASRITVNTILKTLKAENIISMGGKGNIAILDLPRLEQTLSDS